MKYIGTTFWAVVLVLITIVGTLAWQYSSDWRDTAKAQRVVKHICDYSRSVQSGEWEDACGMAQDEANAEYLCNNLTPSAICWVEMK